MASDFRTASVMCLAAFGLAGTASAVNAAAACDAGNGGLSLSPGFCASVFADHIGHARHLVVAPDGTVYVNTWSGRYYGNDTTPPGGFVVALKDTKGSGKADMIRRLGDGADKGAAGGSGIAFYNGALYAEQNDRIVRYALNGAGEVVGQPAVVVSGLPLTGDHPMHPFAIDTKGNLYVDLGSATNSCQAQNRIEGVPGADPCTELETRAGIWRYDAAKTGQHFSPAERFATGIRNGEGISFDSTGRIYSTQHGRDQLSQNWPHLYTDAQSAELPAEEVVELQQGGDYGWPECYFDQFQKKLVLAPEYGGDGGKTQGVCAQKRAPVAAFPGHWAPNDMQVYTGSQFPGPYRGGLFVAFHGSWNRAPLPQGGYNVVFQPMKDGQAAGDYIIFADGFAGATKDPGAARYRPAGLAVAPDGALYIADDKQGRIWRVVYQGGNGAATQIASAVPAAGGSGSSAAAFPPEGIHPDAGRRDVAALPVPPGASRDQIALGDRIYHGEEKGGTCSGCHGTGGKGTPTGPDLTNGKWRWGDGSLAAIAKTINAGVAKPKQSTGVMPPKGGAQLSQADVAAVAAYVWAIGHTDSKNAKAAP